MSKKTHPMIYQMITRKIVYKIVKLHIFRSILLLFVVFLSVYICGKNALCALVYPQRYTEEGRFKTFLYRQNAVYYLACHYTHPTMLMFGPNEKINTISISKSHAWETKLLQNGNILSIKPNESNNNVGNQADTSMMIITNFRMYFFELHARMPTGPLDPDISYFIKFRYPNSILEKKHSGNEDDGSIIQYSLNKGPDLSKPENFNFNYTVSGDYIITPIKVFDDGRFTYFEFKDKNGINPAIFSVDSDGIESIVNFRIINQYVAVEGVHAVFTLRYGKETVCVFNETMRGLTRNLLAK